MNSLSIPSPHIIFAGGGSMEYLHPGMAVAACIEQSLPKAKISFFGAGRAIERYAIRAAGYKYHSIPSRPQPGNAIGAIRYLTDNMAGYCAARWMLNELKADLVVSLGGHASAVTFRAAHAARIPKVLLEQNSMPNSATRSMAKTASALCLGFDEAAAHFPTATLPNITGTPSRLSTSVKKPIPFANGKKNDRCLVVFGGIGGASSLNESVPIALSRMPQFLKGWRVVHQSGEGQLVETEQRYKRLGIDALVVSYIDEIGAILGDADLAVCRAGGSTLAELSQSETPALLVPDKRAGQESELANARIFERQGAARVVEENDRELADALAEQLRPLLKSEEELNRRRNAITQWSKSDAAEKVAETCHNLLGLNFQSHPVHQNISGKQRLSRAA